MINDNDLYNELFDSYDGDRGVRPDRSHLDTFMASDFGEVEPLCTVSEPDLEVERIVKEILDRVRELHAKQQARKGDR